MVPNKLSLNLLWHTLHSYERADTMMYSRFDFLYEFGHQIYLGIKKTYRRRENFSRRSSNEM